MFERISRLLVREFKLFLTNPKILFILLFVPILYTTLFGYTYIEKRVTEIPTWIVDNDKSSLSRSIATAFDRHEYIKVTDYSRNVEEFAAESKKGTVYCCIVIPENLERDLKKNRRVKILTLVEGSNMILANTLLKAGAEVTATFSTATEMKKLNMKGTPSSYTLSSAIPMESQIRLLYNPTLNYMDFLLPGLVATVIQQVAMLVIALSFAKEKEEGTIKEITQITNNVFEVMAAKNLFYLSVNIVMAALCFYLSFGFFGLKFIGSIKLFAVTIIVFITGITALGMIISILAGNQLMATQILMLIAVPSFILSGYTWPIMSMPAGIKTISWLLPLTHFVKPVREISMFNTSYENIRPELLWLWVMAIASYALLYILLAKELKKG